VKELSPLEVVEGDQGNVVRISAKGLAQRAHDTDRHPVVGHDQSGGRPVEGKHTQGRRACGLGVGVAAHDQLRVEWK
jgi:hypothetical protein